MNYYDSENLELVTYFLLRVGTILSRTPTVTSCGQYGCLGLAWPLCTLVAISYRKEYFIQNKSELLLAGK